MVHVQRQAPRVIKAGSTGPVLKGLSHVDLADHLGQAREIVKTARAQAAKTVTDARENGRRMAAEAKERAEARGYEEGFARGEIAGHAKAFEESLKTFEREHAGVVTQMLHAIHEIERIKEGLRIAAERDVLEFAVELAVGLTYRIGRHSSNAAIENVKRALRLVGKRTDLTIRVNPKDMKAMETYASSVTEEIDASPSVAVVTDGSIAAGGCVVETDRSRVDATLETQIAELSALLLGEGSTEGQAAMPTGETEPHSD